MKITKLEAFRTDPALEVDGAWVAIGHGIELRIARARNARFDEESARLSRPYLSQIRRNALDEDLAKGLLRKAVAKTILVGWRGIEDDDGQTLPYSPEKAEKILREYPEIERIVTEFSMDMRNFALAAQESAEGNSGTPSAG